MTQEYLTKTFGGIWNLLPANNCYQLVIAHDETGVTYISSIEKFLLWDLKENAPDYFDNELFFTSNTKKSYLTSDEQLVKKFIKLKTKLSNFK